MTAKEKALELAMNFDKHGETDNAKKCAMIAVDEIIKYCHAEHIGYWQEVRKEIENL